MAFCVVHWLLPVVSPLTTATATVSNNSSVKYKLKHSRRYSHMQRDGRKEAAGLDDAFDDWSNSSLKKFVLGGRCTVGPAFDYVGPTADACRQAERKCSCVAIMLCCTIDRGEPPMTTHSKSRSPSSRRRMVPSPQSKCRMADLSFVH